MSGEEQLNDERSLAERASGQTRGARSIDLTTPRRSRQPMQGGLPPDTVRTLPAESGEIRGYTQQIAVTSQSQLLLPADPKRKFLFISNDDAIGYARISFGAEATLTTGIKIAAGGGAILLDINCPTAAVYIIGSIALNSNVSLISG